MSSYTQAEAFDILHKLLLPKVMCKLEDTNITDEMAWGIMLQVLDPTSLIINPFVGDKNNIVNAYSPDTVAKIIVQNLQYKTRSE